MYNVQLRSREEWHWLNSIQRECRPLIIVIHFTPMHYTLALPLLSKLSWAKHSDKIDLIVEAQNSTFDGKELVGIVLDRETHSNGVVLTSNDVGSYNYNVSSNEIWQPVESGGGAVDYSLREYNGDLILGIKGTPAKFNGHYLTARGSDSVFYACKSLPYDPHQYISNSDEKYAVAIYESDPPSDCYPIRITSQNQTEGDQSSESIPKTNLKINSTNSEANAAGRTFHTSNAYISVLTAVLFLL